MTHCSSAQTHTLPFARVFTLFVMSYFDTVEGILMWACSNNCSNQEFDKLESHFKDTINLYRRRRMLEIGVEAKQCHRLGHAFKTFHSQNACHVEALQQEPYTSHALLEIGAITNKSRAWVGGCISSRMALVVIEKHYLLLIGETR